MRLKIINKITLPKNYLIVREEMATFSVFGVLFLIETLILDRNYMLLISLNCMRGYGNVGIIWNHFPDRNNYFR